MNNYKKIILTLFLAGFTLMGVVTPRPADAQFADVIGGPTTIIKYVWEKVEKAYDFVQGIVGAELSNRTVGMFLDSLAYDVATELATGGPGGKPQFRTISIEKTLDNASQKALGTFLGELTSKGFDELGLNLCDPSLELKLTLTLGLLDEDSPSPNTQRGCEWSSLQKNWADFGDNVQADIIKFQLNPVQSGVTSTSQYAKGMYSSISNFFRGVASQKGSDLGIAFELDAELNQRKLEAEKALELSIEECQGFIDKKTAVTQEVITHCSVTHSMAENLFVNATEIEAAKQLARKEAASNKKLSDILKDAGNRFLNTFTSKLMKNWIKKGMWSLFGNTENDIYQDYRNTLIDRLRGGSDVRQPRGADIFKDIKTVNIETLESFDYLNDFTICPNEFRKPDNCVMSPAFLTAINNKMSIKQAIEQGIIDGRISFVSPNDAINHTVDKCYRDGLCYSNLLKLRKANMIPVGWELAALRAPVSLQQAIDCFEENSKCGFDRLPEYAVDGNPHNPFYHLVDPNWVLKAPDVRCDAYSFSAVLESPESSSRQQYCADPKICLREDADGNCLDDQFNYCTRTENSWNFQGDACGAGGVYAGCLTFANADFGNNSYIEDSLEYCNSNQAGCRRYSQEKDANGNWVLESISSDPNDLFLNNQATECIEENAGCSEYIAMAADTGTNLVSNGSFDNLDADVSAAFPDGRPDGWINDITTFEGDGYDYDGDWLANGYPWGGGAVGTEGIYQLVPLVPNTSYRITASAARYNPAVASVGRISILLCDITGDCGNSSESKPLALTGPGYCTIPNPGDNNPNLNINPTDGEMLKASCTFTTNGAAIGEARLHVVSDGTHISWFDDIKVEMISDASQHIDGQYSDYGDGSRIYMDNAAVMCSADEVGCQGYLPVSGDPMIPAVISQGDLCPAECLGYDTFTEQPNTFDVIEHPTHNPLVEYYNFIPDTTQQCPDQEVGCEEFTNLDVVAEGGEGREYFTYLRQCVEESLGEIYYTWEGTEVSGYQIKTWYALPSSISDAPCTNMAPEGSACQDTAANVASCGPDTADISDDPENNPNCRMFFDVNDAVHYRLQDRIIFATSNCHDYRRALTNQVYKAVPDESIHCAAANNGCRSYYGNDANNIRLATSDNFEQGTYEPWFGVGGGSLVDLSNISLNNNGHSLKAETGDVFARDMREASIQDNKEYVFSWWMKSDALIENLYMHMQGNDSGGGVYNQEFINPATDSNFQNIEAGRWHYYVTSVYIDNLDALDMDLIQELELQIRTESPLANLGLYIDNFIIKEVANNFSVVRNSWETPRSCDDPYNGYHLGCQAYTDLNGRNFNLKSFDHLCREEAIGCMPVIGTNNSTYPFTETFHSGDYSQITVATDNMAYLVPNPNNYCPQEFKGCTELGTPDRLDETKFSTIYKINDPDKYASILCSAEGLNCAEYDTAKGMLYFKDPGANTCTYQQNTLIDNSLLSGWFKTSSLGEVVPLGCADTDNNTDTNGDGFYDVEELILPKDYCSVSASNPTQLPFFTRDDCENNSGYWNNYLAAAQCPTNENLCTSFRDPADPINCDVKGKNLDVGDTCSSNLYDDSASCTAAGFVWTMESRDGYCYDDDYNDNDSYNNERDCLAAGRVWTPYCRDYYYYDNEAIDESSCNGLADRNNGCVLFFDANNWTGEHNQVRTIYDTNETYEDVEVSNRPASPVVCDPSFDPACKLTANKLIKVVKDRQCSEWLACKSSTASYDSKTDEYKIICDELDTCLEFQYDPDSNTTKCKKWGSYDEDVEALTFEKYQSRNTGLRDHVSWSDKEYTGYSIPNMLPVSELSVYDFGQATNKTTRLVYNVSDSADAEGVYYSGCVDAAGDAIDGQACTAVINTDGVYNFRGECQQRICWVSPKVNDNATTTYAIESRAYAITDAPFPAAIESNGVDRLSKYKMANICSNNATSPNSCELSFKRVTFGFGGQIFYYPEELSSGEIPTGICTAGVTTEGVERTTKTCVKNSECDSKNDDGSSRGDGSCALRTEEIVFRNWPGICLEYDLDNPVTKDIANSYYCNQWYPAQKIKGTASLFDNYRDAGYYDVYGRDALFCAVAEPYVTTEDRFYCGYFTTSGEAGQCNVLMKIPAGSKINLEMASQYIELLDEGSWLEEGAGFSIWAAANNNVHRDIILPPGGGFGNKFNRFEHFGNVLPNVTDFMGIINQMFDATEVYVIPGNVASGRVNVHRFYYDDDVTAGGSTSYSSYLNISGATTYQQSDQCQDCPAPASCGANGHLVYNTCWKNTHCGWHMWRHTGTWCNPYTYNYYVDLNTSASGPIVPEVPAPVYEGSCSPDCKFINNTILDSNHGRGCLQAPANTLAYEPMLVAYASSTLPGDFDLAACLANATTDPEDCNFISCVQNLNIANQNNSHLCADYGLCLQNTMEANAPYTSTTSAWMQEDINRCFYTANGTELGPLSMYDPAEEEICLAQNERDFTDRWSGELDEEGLNAYCSKCVYVPAPVTHSTLASGVNCAFDGLDYDPLRCYQQCRIVTQLDSEGLLSAVRTDIWWRSDKTNTRVRPAFPWISYYWAPGRGYVTNTPATVGDDEVLFHNIATFPAPEGDYPNNFSHFGAGLDVFDMDRIVSTRVPYYRASPDNITAATFFSNLEAPLTLEQALDRAKLEMQDIFFRVYNLDWVAASSSYEHYAEADVNTKLSGGNHSNTFAGPDYVPRIFTTCGDRLCETLDVDGNVIAVQEGVTVNGVTGGTLFGQNSSLFTSAKFFYHAHPDHMPVYSIDVDWGDGVVNNFALSPGKYKNSLPADYCNPDLDVPGDANPATAAREPQKLGFGGEDATCQPGYKIFYHDYIYDETRAHDCNGSAGGAAGTPPKPIILNASCYQPRVRVMDNWEWFSMEPFNGWLVVYDS
ncbi:MAG: carbohydrate binding domain-containing protein [Patescibacteria group bacterium]